MQELPTLPLEDLKKSSESKLSCSKKKKKHFFFLMKMGVT